MTDFLAALDGPQRPESAAHPAPVHNASNYALAALTGECDNVRSVPIGAGRNDQLNRSAVKMGGLIAAGVIDEQAVIDALGAADGGLDYKATRDTIASGLRYGMQHARTITERGTPSSSSTHSGTTGVSGDPFSDACAPKSATGGSGSTGSTFTPAAHSSAPDASTSGQDSATTTPPVADPLPIVNWHDLWADETPMAWIIEPLLPERRLVALFSAPKVGKSLLMLELAYGICQGRPVLGSTPPRAYRVLYVDFENDLRGDILPRLINMGAEPGELDNLFYLSLPTLAGLDSERGARELMGAVAKHECEVVIIDTVSRAVRGDENENDTWLSFYRETGLRMKQAGVAMIRLDHTGKDVSKGMRGGSAKEGDVDAVWRLEQASPDKLFRLVWQMSRFPVPAGERMLTLQRLDGPLRHVVQPSGSRDIIVEAVIDWCDQNDVPLDAGYRTVKPRVKDAGITVGQDLCTEALALRRRRNGVDTLPAEDPE